LAPAALAPVPAALLVGGPAAWVAWRADPQRPAAGAAALVGVAFCVVSPEYPWYALLLVALLAAADRPRWLPVAAAAWPAYLVGPLHWEHNATRATGYGLAALAVIIAAAVTRLRPRPRQHGTTTADYRSPMPYHASSFASSLAYQAKLPTARSLSRRFAAASFRSGKADRKRHESDGIR